MKLLSIVWFIFLSFMFIGSKYWGDVKDLNFWGTLLLSSQVSLLMLRSQK